MCEVFELIHVVDMSWPNQEPLPNPRPKERLRDGKVSFWPMCRCSVSSENVHHGVLWGVYSLQAAPL